ncbi:low-complexity tail membrane protein [Cyanobium sp. NS01]|uniref:low-complexity tail membrane protein n=1 Tax=Cyanobium sp. NS01 TaxID=261284 RepID=UPI0016467FE3|nr:low-complexity tail membrane protein [Cyanobium sp. NS01]QNI69739.1 putative conserved membrane protein [Cyanobium sp. NS01]
MTPRSEPLLWLQLIALGAIPLELVLLLLLLAGADPGPAPALERLLIWGLGVLAPSLLLWRQPADCCSLLLVQVPPGGRSPLQSRLAALQDALPARLLCALGALGLLPLLWTLDARAAAVSGFSPLAQSNRLVVLLLSVPLLAVLLWQWHQLTQGFWLLSRSKEQLEQAVPLSAAELAQRRLSLGLPLLLLGPLVSVGIGGNSAVAIEPEQSPEQDESTDLDEQVS